MKSKSKTNKPNISRITRRNLRSDEMTSTSLRWKSDGFLSPLWTTRGTRHGTSIGCWIRWSEDRSDTQSRRNNTREEDRRALHSFFFVGVSLLSPNNSGRQQYSNPEPKESLPKGPFTFTIVATHFFFHFWALELFVWLYYPYVKNGVQFNSPLVKSNYVPFFYYIYIYREESCLSDSSTSTDGAC